MGGGRYEHIEDGALLMLVFLALTFQLVAELNVFLLTPSMRAMVRVDLR